MMAHSKGPWRATKLGASVLAGKTAIAFVHPLPNGNERVSNAQLMAVAPDLLDACKEAAKFIAQCQKAIEANDLSLWPNEAQRLRVENNLWAVIGEVPNA